jgi:outer membrane lipoprotein-sorting protein
MSVPGRWISLALVVSLVSGLSVAGPASRDDSQPPATLLSGEAIHGSAIDPVFAHFTVDRLGCKFSEEKHIALLARPLRSTGIITFERDQGIVRSTLTPKLQQVVLTKTSLRIYKKGKRTEEIPLDKSKDLKAFALIFPTLLRGDRTELERSFGIGLHGKGNDWWALTFLPKTDSLRAVVRKVVVVGRKSEVVSLQVAEASGDTTELRLTEIRKNADVTDVEIAAAFGAP